MLILGLLFGALHIDSVQTFLTKRIASYLSGELHTRVSVNNVSIRFIKSIVLKGFYVEDLHGDTLLYADELTVSISDLSTKAQTLDIGNLTLSKSNFNIVQYKGETHDNLHFISEYFASGDTTKGGKAWVVKIQKLSLNDVNFRHDIQDDSAISKGVDFSHLNVKHIHGDFSEFSTVNDSIFVSIHKLSLKDQSGFLLDEFSAVSKISPTEVRLKQLKIRTPFTDIKTDLTFQFDSFPCFDEFTTRIHWQTDFKNSKVSFTDIAYFAPDLYGIDKALIIDGNFKGAVNNFKGKNVSFKWGDRSGFRGNINMTGLPNIEETFIEVTADEIKTNKKDIEWLPVPPFNEKHTIEVPQNLATLGNVIFKGKFTGFISDFVAFGNVTTDIGSISSDLNLKYNKKNNSSVYSGRLAVSKFDVGKITDVSDLGKVSFGINVKGTGLKLDNINAKLEGKIDDLEFKQYGYKNIVVDGQFTKKLFNGSLTVNEPNVDFDFRGSVDFRGQLPEFDFVADIREAKLDTLNLFRTKEKAVLKTFIRTHFIGNKLDNIVGSIDIDNTDFIYGKNQFHINSISVRADKKASTPTFDVLSDNLDAHFAGQFEFAKIVDAFKDVLPRYLPSVILPQKYFNSNQNFTYDLRLKNLNVFTEVFLPALSIAPNTTLAGHFNSINNELSLELNTSWIQYKALSLDNFKLHATTDSNKLELKATADRVNKNGNGFISLPEISASAENNHINYSVRLADDDSSANRANLAGSMDFFSSSHFNVKIDKSNLIVEDERWYLDSVNQVTFDSTAITFNSFRLYKADESISIDGSIGKKPTDRLELGLSGFNLSHVNSVLSGDQNFLGGIVNGNIFLTDAYHQFQVESDIKISNLSLEGDTLGNASLISRFNSEQNVVVSNVTIIKGVAKILDINGHYYLDRENDNLDFNIHLSNLYLHPLERYISSVMRNVYGKVSADMKLTGSPQKPLLNGTLTLNKTSLIVNYLNTQYSFNSTVNVTNNEIKIDDVKLIDVNNNEATLNGTVRHDYFKNFRFDVSVQAKRFQMLNTTVNDNGSYYGIANASGNAHFQGPIDNMKMEINLSPDRGTKLNIPLNSREDLSSSGFITFIDRTSDTSSVIKRNTVDLSGIILNMNLDMNRNAEIKIIFDEKIGDVITGSGTGSLNLDISSSGAFNMYGTYIIDKGEYLFTLQNLINKKFIIDPGGRITWAGDPYEAVVDLSAIYIVHTSSLYNILQDTIYKQRIPVECKLKLSNKLMNPTISYEITVRGVDPTVESLLQTKLNSEQEINRQMFGLLMLNQFLPTTSGTSQATQVDPGAGATASATELLSNQVSNWLGQINSDFDISVNYRAKDTYSSEELRVMVSKKFLDERLTIEGNVGFLGEQSYVDQNVVGDFYAEYKLSEDGRFRLKGFNRSNVDDIIKYSQSPYTQGFGFFYRKDFNKFRDLFARKKKKDVAP